MRALLNILLVLLIAALLYGAFLFAERLTRQELTRVANPSTQETVCLMWQPRLFRSDGVCSLDLLNAQGKAVDTVRLGILDTGFNALQQFGQIGFQGEEITVTNTRTGEPVQRFVARAGHLIRHD